MNKRHSFSSRRLAAVMIVSGLGLVACGSDDAADSDSPSVTAPSEAGTGLSIDDPWSRQPAEGQSTSAVYGAVTNDTGETVTAIAASTDVSDQVELHQVTMNDEGQMSMSEKEGGYEIAAGETFVFEPGGPHIMLLDIDAATYPDSVDVTLSFDDGSSLDFTAEVRAIGDDAMDMDDMDMDDSEMDDSEMDDDG